MEDVTDYMVKNTSGKVEKIESYKSTEVGKISIGGYITAVNTTNNTITVSNGSTVLLSGSYVNGGNGGLTVKFGSSDTVGSSGGTASAPANGGAKTFVYTGADYSVFAGIALLAVVAVSTIYVRKFNAK